MPHQRILLKLKAHGIGDGIIDWIEQWLTDRRQRVVVDGEVSNWKLVLSGVPQGSVIRLSLFLIYINDLDDNVKSNDIDDNAEKNTQRDSVLWRVQLTRKPNYVDANQHMYSTKRDEERVSVVWFTR